MAGEWLDHRVMRGRTWLDVFDALAHATCTTWRRMPTCATGATLVRGVGGAVRPGR